jgi:hypothetical protein
MKKLQLFFSMLFICGSLFAQTTARLQVIHNSPSPTVDVWVNGAKLLADFKFRTASPFIDAPAGTPLTIEVKAPSSTAATAALATFTPTLTAGKTYVAIATGIVGNAKTPFTLKVIENGLEKSSGSTKTALVVYHGSTDAPAVDVIARGVATIVSGAAYGDATNYFEVPSAKYILDVTPAKNPAIVASFNADLSTLGGGAAVVFASGFLAPKAGEPAFGLFAALPNGTVVALPVLTTARLQVIHNSPSPTVDVWVNGAKLLADFKFRTASPFIDAPANTTLKLEVKAPNSTAATAALATFNVNLKAATTYAAIATGIVGNAITPFDISLIEGALEKSSDAKKVALAVYHGSTDAPKVDVVNNAGGAVLFNDLEYGDADGYLEVPAAKYVLNITPFDQNKTIVAAFTADITTLGGGAAIVMASGFLAPKAGEPAFGLFAVLPSGTVIALPSASVSTDDIKTLVSNYTVYPTLANSNIQLEYSIEEPANIQFSVSDNSGRIVYTSKLDNQNTGQYKETVDVSAWEAGLYHVQLVTKKGSISQKMVKVN